MYLIEASLIKFEYWIRWSKKPYKTMGSCLRALAQIKKDYEGRKWKFRPVHYYPKETTIA